MVCALLACAALFSTGIPADAAALPAHTPTALLQADVLAQPMQAAQPDAPADALESTTTDLFGDLPELLLATPLPLAANTRLDAYLRPSQAVLPHPFPERPQRPPRLTPVTA